MLDQNKNQKEIDQELQEKKRSLMRVNTFIQESHNEYIEKTKPLFKKQSILDQEIEELELELNIRRKRYIDGTI